MKLYLVVSFAILGITHANSDNLKCRGRYFDMIPGFNETMRNKFVDMHNKHRSDLARESQASKMRKLVYDCEIEQTAYDTALQACETTTFTYRKYLKYDENLHVFEKPEGVDDVIKEAIDSWWSENSRIDGEESKNSYTTSYNISNFANVRDVFLLQKYSEKKIA
ncbi:hypothetical protein Y032_0067g58 [Ancylostoma ceylanicum]|uniref:SCP domain-containing protein n=1 Tax=Ancylostoma ceylanicum TaxID=53326 RepID=A0A016TYT8_9BILA|nr:hypothetical protein Y032_0067g58 [Ancylostoma ceylanicum]